MEEKKAIFINHIKDAVSNLFYYDLKNNDDLHYKDVESMIASGDLTLQEVLDVFAKEIKENFPEIK